MLDAWCLMLAGSWLAVHATWSKLTTMGPASRLVAHCPWARKERGAPPVTRTLALIILSDMSHEPCA